MDDQNTFYVLIVAGGSGNRMNSPVPKQFLTVNGLPILMHTIQVFHHNKYRPIIILVLAKADEERWKDLLQKHQFDCPHQIVYGGKQRFDSVKNGLQKIEDKNAIIAVHDAVRPMVSQNTINNCFKTAQEKGNAIAAVSSKDSIRRSANGKTTALDRQEIYLVQTPQTFQYHQLKKAYSQDHQESFTDDASVVEKAGFDIHLEKGDEFNIKITFKEDLLIAAALLA
ncbi:2-C-methyl-D-erythritol 4-phosphate cytidylyltransferase [Pedobacter sp. SD-b]|uniref:2-C-methyl-D-erythritol 4-phosphate cytidylyltransferase n=1 Tax=Pedobacter segetis TaxID=2793069 RepID=A0ABS1BK16_9SPHI|nr:2-C-methyl-D-erythritol 4-phosphate cytidylyltransferase [Pedobacter segetis]MBK0382554.1 2-C-methyl-D-erythritol 4-phosphate cytidylyltransferase [Pedobacter segetis]